jgi:hypothetical protein
MRMPGVRAKNLESNKIQPECRNFNRKAEDYPHFFRETCIAAGLEREKRAGSVIQQAHIRP